jgi:dephospho-CoA kinase
MGDRGATSHRPFILGLVGRAGSGKTTVARALVADGAEVIEADRIGHEITDHDPEVRASLAGSYGTDIYRADGTLDRPRVAARVFRDARALAELNALVHPRIVRRIRERIEVLRREGRVEVVVVDAALMLDWGLEADCDAVLAVVAPEADQVARLMAARGWNEGEARDRLGAQRSNQAFEKAADEVVRNDASPEDLVRAVRAALARLRARNPGAA